LADRGRPPKGFGNEPAPAGISQPASRNKSQSEARIAIWGQFVRGGISDDLCRSFTVGASARVEAPGKGPLPCLLVQSHRQHQRHLPRVWVSGCRKGKELKRKLFTFAALLSLMLCAATAPLWVRSIWNCDTIIRLGERTGVEMDSLVGRLSIGIVRVDKTMWVRVWDWQVRPEVGLGKNDMGWKLGGFSMSHTSGAWVGAPIRNYIVIVPDWFLVVVFGVMPVVAYRSMMGRRRLRIEMLQPCAKCSYPLRGNTSGACPECGIAPSKLGRGG
jgi:hypothetical protein